MIDVEVATTIRAPRIDVATVMFDPRFDAAWIGGVRQAGLLGPAPLGPGSQVERLLRRLAQRLEVIDYVPARRLALQARRPTPVLIRYELEGIPEGTIARVALRAELAGWRRWVGRAIRVWRRRAVIRDLTRLKAFLESGAWRQEGETG